MKPQLFIKFLTVTLLLSFNNHVCGNTQTNDSDDSVNEVFDMNHESYLGVRNAWRPIQTKVRDTVVQIFAQKAEFDWLQPYRTPLQYAARGSGFLINDQGEIVTNAHVIDEAMVIWIQIPSLGKMLIDVEIVSICPDRDLALLKITDEYLEYIHKQLGKIPFLVLGDSDSVYRADEVLALGYPLGQESLKSTSGVVSGREIYGIQISNAINPGSSGGPLLNAAGEVIGISTLTYLDAQNVNYAIAVNDLKVILNDLYKVKLLRKPFLGILSINGTPELAEYLGNPTPGGCYIVEIVKNSPLYKAGVQSGDMLYEINGLRLDIFGDMSVAWSEDKVSIIDYVSRLTLGETIQLVIYRNGERKELNIQFTHSEAPSVRKIFPGYEKVDYEVFGGMVVMELTLNHVKLLMNHAPGLIRYTEPKNQAESVLIVTHIFPSQLFRSRTISPGVTLKEINGMPVKTLEDFRQAILKGIDAKYFTIKAVDNLNRSSDNLLVVLPFDKVLEEEASLARNFHYPISKTVQEMFRLVKEKRK